jgi:heptosyltransferase III
MLAKLQSRLLWHLRCWQKRDLYRERKAQLKKDLENSRAALRVASDGSKLVGISLIEHLGDIIACEPVARFMRKTHPQLKIVWLTKPLFKPLLTNHPAIGDVIEVTCLSESAILSQDPLWHSFIDLHLPKRPCARLPYLHRKSSGDRRITSHNYFNFGSILESFCMSAGLPPLQDPPLLFIESNKDIPDIIGDYIVIHATSNESTRDWVIQKWTRLISELRKQYTGEIIEVGLESRVAPHMKCVKDLCGKRSLAELARIIDGCRLYIGVDSGPAHIANAQMKPAVILTGKYRSFTAYCPYTGYFRKHKDLMLMSWSASTADIPMEEVLHRCREVLHHSKANQTSAL